MNKPIALIIGVGDRNGIGASVAVKAASEGMYAVMVGRTVDKLNRVVDEILKSGGDASYIIADSTKPEDIRSVFNAVSEMSGALRFVVYNTGRNMPAPFLEHTPRIIEDHWKRCVLGGTVVGQEAVIAMRKNQASDDHKGTIIFTGASASLRGKPLFAGFSAAKAGIRSIAQSMAKEFGSEGIHVSNVIVDGLINGALVRSIGTLGELLIKNKGEDGALLPDEIAKAFWMIHSHYPSTPISELDLRPYKEQF